MNRLCRPVVGGVPRSGAPAPDNEPMTSKHLWTAAAALSVAACSPPIDWREFVPDGSGIGVSFPCRPDRHERVVVLAGAGVPMRMFVCSTSEMTFALSFVDVAEPAAVGQTLMQLHESTVLNLHGVPAQHAPLTIANATPNPAAGRFVIDGRLPDGGAVQAHSALFVRGLRVYQATVIGAKPEPSAVDTFLGSLRFPL
jgi:hypothetical protein